MNAERAALVLLASLAVASCRARVVGDLDEAEANRVIIALEKAGIPATKTKESRGRSVSWIVKVDGADAPRARMILESLSLPRRAEEGFEEIVEEDSIVPSASRERLRQTVARSREIARTLETLEGVLEASVLLAPAEPPPPGAGRDEIPAAGTASALLKVAGEPSISDEEVCRLVAGAVPGLEPEGVTVVLDRVSAPDHLDTEWARLGPFVVSPSTRAPLMAVLAVMATLNLALGGWAVTSVVLRKRRRRPAEREAPSP